ncbi:glutathione S-transferase family protein [Frateuria hangzhouensis]|uniref:glutathione S-transferase family protein n=1 Tax=Frateuria hangzhouensis TaxID=2995589 RepID=UPI002260ABA5|nr:glutathione S-transferase family protein [Frateuria sp. STR12]MCX7515161.1 glutathione S-transferase family protein [Frateuria sp. STR12]
MTRVLYSGTRNASSWAFRAWLALKEAGVSFDEEVVDIRRPQRFANLDRIRAFSPPGAVPVLVDGDAVIFDSLAIMEYASELAGGVLLPGDPRKRAHVRSLVSWQHAGLSGLCPRLSFESAFYPDRRAMTDGEVADASRIFEVWEQELARSGGPWLAGALSLADLAFAPTVVRLHAHAPDLAQWPRAAAWMTRLLARDTVRAWMDEARTLAPVQLDDYGSRGQ